ncbi:MULTISPECIES: amidohydrolase [unclassified Pseudomonas]|uniref:amidohydrolase family protein n=1 Tax=unclassified Pseudomonas TaxID=196821 RepID=UPI000BD36D0E|nr:MULTISPECIES: amidohydrolase family protein [unclassified Pseudomonas]PVZ16466.1 putative TIM-barrel fold metal-dependent hydrolase [Pseudomonas sp. URIL14HWK12:I12]PVZ25678.1 putative TIM-barrel fold metal-dependent hydrolase [Pseudomonas sp. URIL14HWK12:I10]PVZ36798.1 putative TIM-barrel fold metal-dependent hydrolase [Pseudomonas sp. URIL14HWK12:I11]SNZ12592.1 Predicted metal-dependent hydrolase, TIM-barrel fold [Pseudomonas sp. URIL14HWK12:I9]
MSIFDEPKIDCHSHLFDPEQFPYAPDTPYAPSGQEVASRAQFERVLEAYRVRHALLVGPNSGYGLDNRCLLHALAHGRGRFKGVAVVAHGTSLEALAALQTQGVVGIAFNPALEGVASMATAAPLLGRLAEVGLIAQVQVQGDQLLDLLPLLQATPGRVLIDHCGRPAAEAGVGQAGFQALLRLAVGGRTWVKLSGMQKFAAVDHLETQAGPYVDALLEHFGAERCLWGSDWPFIRSASRIDYGPLLKLAERWLPDPGTRRQVMWSTPLQLFGFPD